MSEIEVPSENIIEPVYKMIWKDGSQNAGYIEHAVYKQSQLPEHNREEVLGPDREFVEAPIDSPLYLICVDNSLVTKEHPLWEHRAVRWDWQNNELITETPPPLTWDDIRMTRNIMLASSDNMFNIDTPDPLKQQWIDNRQLLRELPEREQAADRTPNTVFWDDYLPPYPASARGGLTDEDAAKCVWYDSSTTVKKSTNK